jgi:hypothetical protein
MLKHFKEREPIPTELSWEEKNPINYLYQPSKDILWLRQKMAKSQEETKPTRGNKSRKATESNREAQRAATSSNTV